MFSHFDSVEASHTYLLSHTCLFVGAIWHKKITVTSNSYFIYFIWTWPGHHLSEVLSLDQVFSFFILLIAAPTYSITNITGADISSHSMENAYCPKRSLVVSLVPNNWVITILPPFALNKIVHQNYLPGGKIRGCIWFLLSSLEIKDTLNMGKFHE